MTPTATDPLFPYTVLFLSGEGAVECSLVLAADAVAALGIVQARYAADAGPAAPGGGEDAAAQDLGDTLPAAECLAVYPGHQIGALGGVSSKPAGPAAGARVGAAPAFPAPTAKPPRRAAIPTRTEASPRLPGPARRPGASGTALWDRLPLGWRPQPSAKAPPEAAAGNRVRIMPSGSQRPASHGSGRLLLLGARAAKDS